MEIEVVSVEAPATLAQQRYELRIYDVNNRHVLTGRFAGIDRIEGWTKWEAEIHTEVRVKWCQRYRNGRPVGPMNAFATT